MPESTDARKRQVIEQEVAAFTECGALHGCPFCIGRMQYDLKQGEKIAFLSGINVGRIATIRADTKSDQDEFQVIFPNSPKGSYYLCSHNRDEFVRYPLPSVPDWLCPLSIEDLNYLENSILRVIFNSIQTGASPDVRLLAKSVASLAWNGRLPVTGAMVFETLVIAHAPFVGRWRRLGFGGD
jgi:hypothetical protein